MRRSTTTLAGSFAYDNVDHLESMTLGNGIVEGRTYDGLDRLESISAYPAIELSYGHDAVGNIVSITDEYSQ